LRRLRLARNAWASFVSRSLPGLFEGLSADVMGKGVRRGVLLVKGDMQRIGASRGARGWL